MTESLFARTSLEAAVDALEHDLRAEGGPQISTMRNFRFAILVYEPTKEYELRRLIREMTGRLEAEGWTVVPISLYELMLARVRATGPGAVEALVARERRLYQKDPARALAYLQERIAPLIEGPEGVAADVVRRAREVADEHPDRADRTLVLIGRTGAMYPFFRSSALLKHLDGKTGHVPVVLLYPGKPDGKTGLRFMDELAADRDYRPRIYK